MSRKTTKGGRSRSTGGTSNGTTGSRKRHSPSTRKPATIDLEPNASRVKAEDAKGDTRADAGADAKAEVTSAKTDATRAADKTSSIAPKTAGKAETAMGGGAASDTKKLSETDTKGTSSTTTSTTDAAKTGSPKADASKTGTSKTDASKVETPNPAKSTSVPKVSASDAKETAAKPTTSDGATTASGGTRSTSAKTTDTPASKGTEAGRTTDAAKTAAVAAAGTAATSAIAAKSTASTASASTAPAKKDGTRGSSPTTDTKTGATSAPSSMPTKTGTDTKIEASGTSSRPSPSGPSSSGPPSRSSASSRSGTSGSGIGALLAAGLVGGIVTLGGAWALGAFDRGDGLASLRSDLETRVAAIENIEAPPTLTREQVDEAIAAALAQDRDGAGSAAPDEATAARLTQLENDLATARGAIAALEDDPSSTTALDEARAVISALEGRIGELSQRLDQAENAGSAGLSADRARDIAREAAREGLSPVEARVKAVEDGLDARIASARDEAVTPLAERLDAAERTLATEREGTLATAKTVEEVRTVVDALNEGQKALIGRLDERAKTVDERLAALDKSVSEGVENLRTELGETKGALDKTGKAVETVTAEVETVKTSVSDLGTRLDETAKTLETRVDNGLTELRTTVEDRAAALDGRLGVVEKDMADTGPEERAAAALALANLRTRLDAGEAFGTELELVRDTQAQVDLEPLRAYSANGIPSVPQLREGFDAASERIVTATRPAAEGAVGQLFSNLRSQVKIERLDGAGGGESVSSILGEVRSALASNDLAAADKAWQRLPEKGREVSSEWHAGLLARMKADEVLPAALDRLIRGAG